MLTVIEIVLWMIRFLFGACIFSFLNVVADRLPREEGIVRGRSHCVSCGRVLTGWELIPCVSYLCLRGKCRGCGTKIPFRCFWTELIGGAAFISCGAVYGYGSSEILSLRGLLVFIYIGILLVVALIDWDTQMIYDRFHIMIFILAVISIWFFPEHGMVDRLWGAAVVAVPMLLLALVIPGAFGGGDIKLMAVSGLFLGLAPEVCAMFFGLVTGGLYGMVMLKSGKLGKKDQFAFGPFLAVGLTVAALWGDRIVQWYLQFLF